MSLVSPSSSPSPLSSSSSSSFSQKLKKALAHRHLLNHPFYQAWNKGELTRNTLKEYAAQYYNHVKAFPRYISATHSLCEDIEKRRLLLENLADEEGLKEGHQHHPELWMQFAEGMGMSREEVQHKEPAPSIKKVVETFMSAARSSYAEGLASLYAYEYQVPEVAETKIKGLKEHYQVQDPKTLSFFEVHKEADKLHRQVCEDLMNSFSSDEKAPALQAAQNSAQALWDFLTDMMNTHENFENLHSDLNANSTKVKASAKNS